MRKMLMAGVVLGGALWAQQVAAGQAVGSPWDGNWDCRIDGRASTMQWYVESYSETHCQSHDVCSTTESVRRVGRFRENTAPWAKLQAFSMNDADIRIRYLGAEPDNWYLRFDNTQRRSATGWTTWRGKRYPLTCAKTSSQVVLTTPRQAMAQKARELNWGTPHSDSPTPRQTPTPRNNGYWQRFNGNGNNGGWVYWTPEAEARAVYGEIFAKWAQLGWEQGRLGFPISDEYQDGNFRRSDFQYGWIKWSAQTGTMVSP